MAKRIPDIRNLALRQRRLIWLLLFAILLQFVPYLTILLTAGAFLEVVTVACSIARVVVYVLMAIGVIRVLIAQGNHILIIIVCGLLMLAPCANVLLLILINMSATRTLRRAGVKVHFMGVDPEELERILNTELCLSCGYNLTGNVSGICSECGRPTARNTAGPSPRTSG